jgi:hypothetical protein
LGVGPFGSWELKYRYSKYTGEDLDGLDLESLVAKLSDLLLASGFSDPHFTGSEDDRRRAAG